MAGVNAIDGSFTEAHYAFQGGREDIYSLISMSCAILRRRRQLIAIAESMTGGMLANLWFNEPDVASVFAGATITVGEKSLSTLLDVPEVLLENFTIASGEVARAMVEGIGSRLGSHFSIGIVGVDSRYHSSASQPVGLVWVAFKTPTRLLVQRLDFSSYAYQRTLISERACYAACKIFLQILFEEKVPEMPESHVDDFLPFGVV
ncbi:MAG: CinA family protein [Puniceicoccales bacterium]|jgi:PncC family amidohydrolase|nr:CinA family protein [Puniceicoccales bacterium]